MLLKRSWILLCMVFLNGLAQQENAEVERLLAEHQWNPQTAQWRCLL